MAGPWERFQKQQGPQQGPWTRFQSGGKLEVPLSTKAEAALQGFGQGAAFGYQPQLQAAAGGLIPDPNAALNEKLMAEGFTIEEPQDTYVSRRDAAIRREQGLIEAAPGAYTGGLLGGAIAGSAAIPGASAMKAATAAGRVGQAAKTGAIVGAIQNPGDVEGEISPVQAGSRVKGALIGGALGGAMQAGGEAIKKGAETIAAAPASLKQYGGRKAFKSSGAMLKDFRKAFGKGRVEELGQEMIESGMVKPGSTFDDVARISGGAKQEVGTRIGSIYDEVGESALVQVDPTDLHFKLIDSVDAVKPKLKGTAFDDTMDKVITDISGKGSRLNDPRYVNDVIGEVDDLINYSKRANELPAVQQGYLEIRRALRTHLNDVVEKTGAATGNPSLAKELKTLNKRYGNLTEINSIAKDRVARENANRAFGLTDTIAGVGGAVGGAAVGGMQSGDIEGALKGAAIGSGLGLLNKGARSYGTPIVTQAAYGAGKALSKVPQVATESLTKAGGLLASQPGMVGAVTPAMTQKRGKK